jgi:hypothetical protein
LSTQMQCLVCGSDMRAAIVEPDNRVGMHSFQYRTFRCESCGDSERRFAFEPEHHDQSNMPGQTVSASIVPDQPAEGEIQSRMARIVDALSLPLTRLFNK